MWFKVDDTLHSHPKTRTAGLDAMGLWAMSGAFCMAYKLPGRVPEWFVQGFPKGKQLATRLVDAGLWRPAEGGWEFHDWDDYQPEPDVIERTREKARERQRRRRGRVRDEEEVSQ